MTTHPEEQYLNIGSEILQEGVYKPNRTGVGTYSLFGRQMRFNLQEGFPLLTTKKVALRPMIQELLWFLKGSTDNNLLREMGAKIWDQWATEDGDLGPIYGKQWVDWEAPDLPALHETVEKIKELIIQRDQARPSSQVHVDQREVLENNIDILRRLDELQEEIRNPPKINQIQEVIEALESNPNSRRILVTAWNPAVLPLEQEWEFRAFDEKNAKAALYNGWEWCGKNSGLGPDVDGEVYRKKRKLSPQENVKRGKAALPACHTMFQFYTRPLSFAQRFAYAKEKGFLAGEYPKGGYEGIKAILNSLEVPHYALSCQLYQRSADWPIGVPFNIASYAALTMMVAHVTNMMAEEFIWTGGDVHIYENQAELFEEQTEREPYPFPKLLINDLKTDIFDFVGEDFTLVGYEHHPKIKYPVAV